jgi:phosphoribosyl 1,2-cyclic phosphodiesterase/DNA-binding response OmpR family regulator
MRVRFWGTRGSIAKAGPTTVRYGGNTSCVEVRSARGTLLVLDCGTGAHGLGQALSEGAAPVRGHLLLTHTHWDHIQGMPFFMPLFVPGNEWDVYAPRGLRQSLRQTLAGQMQYPYFPVSLEQLGATIRYHGLVEGSFRIDDVTVTAQYLNHPALTLGYRIEADGVAVVYATDHEPHAKLRWAEALDTGEEQRHARLIAGGDLVIHDAQYLASEYAQKAGWGHSPVEYVVETARRAGVKRLVLHHHDPLRDDDAIDRLLEVARRELAASGSPLVVLAAAEGQVIDVEPVAPLPPGVECQDVARLTAAPPALDQQAVLIAVADTALRRALADAVEADGARVLAASDGRAAVGLALAERPAVVFLERALPGADALELARTIRRGPDAWSREVPIVVVAASEAAADRDGGAAAGVTDWLVAPFSAVYARTRVHAWRLRQAVRWQAAPRPPGEERRLAALRRLALLDTEDEERFDRITRLAAALFDVPIALVTLVDAERQWFKSSRGFATRATEREASFCAHVILDAQPMIVPDARLDPRFADSPLVTGEPGVRFYAGYPLTLPDGSRVGTLCLMDRRPRTLSAEERDRLRDLAMLAEREVRETLNGQPPRG